MDRQRGRVWKPSHLFNKWGAAFLIVLGFCGCERGVVTHQVRKPTIEFQDDPSEVDSLLAELRRERERRCDDASTIRRNKKDSVRRFAEAVGDDYVDLLRAEPFEVSFYVSNATDVSVNLHAQELATHIAHLQVIETRLADLEAAISALEAAQRIRQNLVSIESDVPPQHELISKLTAIAAQEIDLPISLSVDEVGNFVAGELAVVRDEARRREEAERQARSEVARKLGEEAAQREAERLGVMEAERRRVEAEALREARIRDANTALQRYADGYHRFFRGQYHDAEALFDEAIRLDATDARYFYFRGLARKRLGKSGQAMDDFRAGGEAERLTLTRGVAQALERIQGQERMLIERSRP